MFRGVVVLAAVSVFVVVLVLVVCAFDVVRAIGSVVNDRVAIISTTYCFLLVLSRRRARAINP